MIFGDDNQQVNIPVKGKLLNRVKEIIHSDKIKLGIEFGKHFLHLSTFSKIFICKRHIMFVVYIHNMQVCAKKFQNCFDRKHRRDVIDILKIRSQRDVLYSIELGVWWYD